MILTGAGQIGMAIARRMGYGMRIVIGDKNKANAEAIAKTMNEAGFDTVPVEMDLSSRTSILNLIAEAQKYGEISMLVNAAGVSPSQAPIGTILKVDLYGRSRQSHQTGRYGCYHLQPVGTSHACTHSRRGRTACHYSYRGTSLAGHASGGKYPRYAARLPDG